MTMYLPPMQRKKKVVDKYSPDTFRVISEDAISDHPKYKPLPYAASFEPSTPLIQLDSNQNHWEATVILPLKNTKVLPQNLPDYRAHNPQPTSCGFLDKNVRFLNEPICHVFTKPVQHEEGRWWPARANAGSLHIPPYAEDTHYRIDYNYRHGEKPQFNGRHTANPNKDPAYGSVPVNFLRQKDGSQRLYKEGLSYEHQYNSRSDPNYPNRGRRMGAFVWSRMDPVSQNKFIEYYSRLAEEERKAEEKSLDGPLKSCSAPVLRSFNHKDFKPKGRRSYTYKRREGNILRWEDEKKILQPSSDCNISNQVANDNKDDSHVREPYAGQQTEQEVNENSYFDVNNVMPGNMTT
uniref:Uncharacterized protein n=1 Tax=Biomphalaria glabrata TaxID=6526 RepID=A0A2C9LY86_BIOGL